MFAQLRVAVIDQLELKYPLKSSSQESAAHHFASKSWPFFEDAFLVNEITWRSSYSDIETWLSAILFSLQYMGMSVY